ncbi:ATP-binding protein [Thermodesulfovibrio yellowstonii]|uniref:Uncharacterized protein n=1 Tax=Thermodesulfovibrio yellowstonii TaxID=28262 RepID=A0A9W6GGH8_9BACT|nr:DUF499 domain-containing protein [Thermodesulfovibrio islandicus]GLI53725.1 hypothetical protein TISLANDTSLP1_14180 [Thermodesulfovibrio islandicus]
MTAFTEIAIPHRDILEGRFTLDAYASDLWEVVKGTAPEEYRDRETFFDRTYETEGLKQIVQSAENRLKGGIADPVVQLQTPFGGGKTHTLIYLYHKAKEWNANVFVFSGDKISAEESTIWEEMERQLSGKVELFKGRVPPGGERIKKFLTQYEPLLILMDEVHAYLVGAQGIKVEESNLASQSLLFIQILTNTVKSMNKTALFLSLPASSPYDDLSAQNLLNKLKNIAGRTERVVAPVNDEEVTDIIRRRLFSRVDETKAKKIIKEFTDFAERENILPQGVEKAHYRDRFLKSYPFQPEIIDVLYKRWGSFSTFQRTRGVLRLLALVVHSLISLKRPYIRLADFNLKNEEIRRELIKHIGQEYDSIIAQDITSETSGARKVDRAVGESYRAYYFGTAVATTIFMYSFSGAGQRGATVAEIKLSASEPSVSSSIIVETIEKLKENLFYLADEGLFFKNRPNLNKVLIDKMESIGDDKIESLEKELLKGELKGNFDNYLWPQNSRDIPDTPAIKLVILRRENGMKEIYDNYGDRPRIYKNTLIFLASEPSERVRFENELKKFLAWKNIERDSSLSITDEQRKEIKERLKQAEDNIRTLLRNLYRKIYVPSKEGFKEIDLGICTYGKDRSIDREVYERLKTEGELVGSLAPKVLLDRYLQGQNYVGTKKIFEAFLKVPGEIRIPSDEVLKTAIKSGVREGLFGLGNLEGDKVRCVYFKEDCGVNFTDDEVLIKSELCEERGPGDSYGDIKIDKKTVIKDEPLLPQPPSPTPTPVQMDLFSAMKLEVRIPPGKFSNFIGTMRLIDSKFKNVAVKISIEAFDGNISKSDYEAKIKEAFRQSGIIIEKEELE